MRGWRMPSLNQSLFFLLSYCSRDNLSESDSVGSMEGQIGMMGLCRQNRGSKLQIGDWEEQGCSWEDGEAQC